MTEWSLDQRFQLPRIRSEQVLQRRMGQAGLPARRVGLAPFPLKATDATPLAFTLLFENPPRFPDRLRRLGGLRYEPRIHPWERLPACQSLNFKTGRADRLEAYPTHPSVSRDGSCPCQFLSPLSSGPVQAVSIPETVPWTGLDRRSQQRNQQQSSKRD